MKINLTLPFLTFVVFFILKCIDKITWSWWWVTSPLWISGILVIAALIYLFVDHMTGPPKFRR